MKGKWKVVRAFCATLEHSLMKHLETKLALHQAHRCRGILGNTAGPHIRRSLTAGSSCVLLLNPELLQITVRHLNTAGFFARGPTHLPVGNAPERATHVDPRAASCGKHQDTWATPPSWPEAILTPDEDNLPAVKVCGARRLARKALLGLLRESRAARARVTALRSCSDF